MVTLKCLECSKEFEAQRSSAKFCSPKCRVDYNRRGADDEKDLQEVASAISINAAFKQIEKEEETTTFQGFVELVNPEPEPQKAVLQKVTFKDLLTEFNSLVDNQTPIKQVEAKLYELIEKSQHHDLNARQSEAIRSRCINYLTGQYGKKKQS